MLPDEILAALSSATDDIPFEALRAAADQRDALAAPLLDALRAFAARAADPDAAADADDGALADMAMYLLAQFRDTRAFPLYEALCRLPEERCENWLGDVLSQDFASFLASTCGGDPAPLQRLAQDPDVCRYSRWTALGALVTLVVNDAWPRSAMVTWLRDIWPSWRSADSELDLTPLVGTALDLGASDLLPLVREAYEKGLTDPTYAHVSEIEERCAMPDPLSDEYLRHRHRYVDDAAQQMAWQGQFHELPDADSFVDLGDFEELDDFDDSDSDLEPAEPYVRREPKVGRNDPCPCGSGRKYKKCCLRADVDEDPPVDLAVLQHPR